MKKIKILFVIVTVFFVSCDSLIDPGLDNRSEIETLLNNPALFEGILLKAYSNMPGGFNFDIDAATDDAVTNKKESEYRHMASNGWLATNSPVSKWDYYKQIYSINLFLENLDKITWVKGYKLTDAENERYIELHRQRLFGEAHALRAWYQFQLLQAHGGSTSSGDILGVPVITNILPLNEVEIPRSTYEQCVQQINSDCDVAISNLPFVYTDVAGDYVFNITLGARYLNRINASIARAIKAKTALYAASPAFNPTNDVTRWQMAAKLSGDLLTDLGAGSLRPSTTGHIFYTKNFNSADVKNEVIWRSERKTGQSAYEQANFPPSKEGKGNINPSQNLIDAFPDKFGYPINMSSSYKADSPYDNRDPRLGLYIVYNGNPARKIYTYEGAERDGINLNEFATRTGYYLRKFINESVSIVGGKITGADRFHTYFRHTDLMLQYAEAANEVYGPDGYPDGINFTSRDVINAIRTRAGLPPDYVNSLSSNDEFRTLIQNERRIELCFEGERFWDMRRWKLVDIMKEPAKGMLISKSEDGLTFSYQPIQNVESRLYKDHMIYGPIPYLETLKYNIQQNMGW